MIFVDIGSHLACFFHDLKPPEACEGLYKDKNSSFKRFIVECGLIFIIWGTLILGFFAYFNSFFKLKAVAAMSIHLLACLSPLVFTFCMPRKLIKVPNTGSTVLILYTYVSPRRKGVENRLGSLCSHKFTLWAIPLAFLRPSYKINRSAEGFCSAINRNFICE